MSDESRPRTAGGEFAPISALWKVGHALWLRVGWTTARVAQRSPESSGSFGVRKATSALRLQSAKSSRSALRSTAVVDQCLLADFG